MRKILLIALIVTSCHKSFSQKKLLGEVYFEKELKKTNIKAAIIPSYLFGSDTLSFTKILKAKNGGGILRLDNMPCFVPDVTNVEKMPAVKNRGFSIIIPNAYNMSSN